MLTTLPELITQARTQLRCIDAQTAIKEIEESGGTMIDVREPGELLSSSATQAVNIPRGVLEMKVPEMITDEDQPVYLHCATGGRATLAAEQLKRLGYKNVSVITCGADTVRQHQEAMK